MNTGDVVQNAIWINGEESGEDRVRYENDVCDAIEDLCTEEGFNHTKVEFVEKHPMDADVPEVPNHIFGERVRLLVGEALILNKVVESPEGSFVANLELKDLKRLRSIIHKNRPSNVPPLSNMECDEIIEQIGPEAALSTLRLH